MSRPKVAPRDWLEQVAATILAQGRFARWKPARVRRELQFRGREACALVERSRSEWYRAVKRVAGVGILRLRGRYEPQLSLFGDRS